MTVKELQEQYAAQLQPKVVVAKESKTLIKGYRDHVRAQAHTLTRLLGRDQGVHYIQEAFKDWPEVLEKELNIFKHSLYRPPSK